VRHITIPPPPGLSFVSDGYIPARSPDGATVVFAARDGDQVMLYRRPVDGFEAEAIEGTEDAEYPFFSPDGQWVGFFTENPDEIRKVLLEGGDPIPIVTDLNAARNDAIWRRDGTIVFSWERQGLWSVSDAGGEPLQLTTPDPPPGSSTMFARRNCQTVGCSLPCPWAPPTLNSWCRVGWLRPSSSLTARGNAWMASWEGYTGRRG